MPFNGAGNYSPPGADFPAVANTLIESAKFNNVINDIATGLSTCITKDGQTTVTANIPGNGFYLTNWGLRAFDGAVGTPSISFKDDTDCGLYRIGANNLGLAIGGAQALDFSTTVVAAVLALAANAGFEAKQNVQLSGDLTPAQITGNQNDYNPGSLSTATVLRLSTDANRTITGLQGGADGRLIVMENVGSFPITLTDESASSTAANRFALGGAPVIINYGQALTFQYDSTSSRWRLWHGPERLPGGAIFGFTLSNNAGDATNDIDFAAGTARDSTNVIDLKTSTGLTKQLDAAWAAGTNAGGRMSAAAIANTTYACYAIRKDSDGSVDFGFDTSATAPTMPTGYTYFRRLGFILREAGAIVAFLQDGDNFWRSATALDINVNNPGTAAVTRTMSVPVGANVTAVMRGSLTITTAGSETFGVLTDLALTDEAASGTNSQFFGATALSAGQGSSGNIFVRTNTSAQIRSRVSTSDATVQLTIRTIGWIDSRGKNS